MLLPFLTIPIALPGDEIKENPDKVVNGKIQPINIDCYHPGYDWGSIIYMKSGQPFMTTWTVEQLEAAIQSYFKDVSSKAIQQSKILRMP